MRVGIMTDCLEYGPLSIGIYTKNVVENLLLMDVDIVLLHHQEGTDTLYKKVEEVILPRGTPEVLQHNLSFVEKPLYNLFHYYKVQPQLEKAGIDLVHLPHLGRPAPPVSSFFLKKVVVTNHGMAPLSLPPECCYSKKLSRQRLNDLVEFFKWKLLKSTVDTVITVSESEKRVLLQRLSLPPEKITVIYHGVSPDFTVLPDHDVKRTLEKFDIDYPFALHVSAYQPKKNVARIIKAVSALKTEHNLIIVGPHTKSTNPKVVFTGYIDIKDLVALYNAAEVFVFPSLHESFGMPLLEAMACGCPVVTSTVCSMPEIVGDAAVLVDPYCTKEITTGINRIIMNDDIKNELRTKGLHRVTHFSWKKCAEQHLAIYQRCFHGT